MKKKKIKVNLMRGDAVAAQLIIPMNEDPAGEWPRAVENAIDQSGIRNIIDFVTREPENAAPEAPNDNAYASPSTERWICLGDLRKAVEEAKEAMDKVYEYLDSYIRHKDELPF